MSEQITGTYRSDELSDIKSVFLRKLQIEFQQMVDVEHMHFMRDNHQIEVRMDMASKRIVASIRTAVLSNPESRKVEQDPILKALCRYCSLPEGTEPETVATCLDMMGQDAAAMIVREKAAHLVQAECNRLFKADNSGNSETITRICPHIGVKCESTHFQWLTMT